MRYDFILTRDNTKDGDQWFGEVYAQPQQDDDDAVHTTGFCATWMDAQADCNQWIKNQEATQ
jgi:hypothetical protein